MLNKEKFKDEIMEIACSGNSIALDKRTNKPVNCNNINCCNCGFKDTEGARSCKFHCKEWCYSEYKEPEIDWSKVPIDTPILVRGSDNEWYKRYFAKYKDNEVYSYSSGATSWSSDKILGIIPWEFAKLANEEDIKKYAK